MLAPVYGVLEWCLFLNGLNRCRCEAMLSWRNQLLESQQMLIVGDGRGYFLKSILELNDQVRITSLDISPRMIAVQRRSLRDRDLQRVRFVESDLLRVELGTKMYDAVVLPFVLDCFAASQLDEVVAKLTEVLRSHPGRSSGAIAWIDFEQPARQTLLGWMVANVRLKLMHTFFGIFTGLPNRSLVPIDGSFAKHGLRIRSSLRHRCGVQSRIYQRP